VKLLKGLGSFETSNSSSISFDDLTFFYAAFSTLNPRVTKKSGDSKSTAMDK